jgi:hypothetical protein
MFASKEKMRKMPEIGTMQAKIMTRIGALAAGAILVFSLALTRVGLLQMSFKGPIGTTMLLIGVMGMLILLADRDSYLPFLGYCVLPPSTLALRTPRDSSVSITVNVPPNAMQVMYWASESAANTAPTPHDAYGHYENAGVAKVHADGTSILRVRCPGQYMVRGNKLLPRHVHYRTIYASGIAGPVETVNVACL